MKEETQKKATLILGVAFLVLLIASVLAGGFFCGKSCAVSPPVIDIGIDAGPGLDEIDSAEDAAEKAAAVRLEAIEAKRRESIESLEGEQRDEYERVREEGPDAVLDWLNAFDRERFAP